MRRPACQAQTAQSNQPAIFPRARNLIVYIYAAFAARGYGVVKNLRELQVFNASKLLGISGNSHVTYEADRRFEGMDAPSLLQMVRAGLPRLAAHSSGFVGFCGKSWLPTKPWNT